MTRSDPWDREFETKADYSARVSAAEVKVAPISREKNQKIIALKTELSSAMGDQITPLNNQLNTLMNKRFSVPTSEVSFKFLSYQLSSQEMIGEIKINGTAFPFKVYIPKLKARKYKRHPDLLVPEVITRASLHGLDLDKIVFHGPNQNDKYTEVIRHSIGMEFVYVSSGTFMMGSPSSESGRDDDERQHRVTLNKGFYMQSTEVTQGQWKAVMVNNPSHFKFCGNDCPVEKVSWNDVQEFIRKLNQREGENRYRLPTETEWEYVARAGSTTRYCFGDDENRLSEYAWYSDNSGSKTHPVAEKKANAWGLYDMHGNVREWCQDWKGDYSSGSVTNPSGPPSGSYRVIRGGSWNSDSKRVRCAVRGYFSPVSKRDYLGFRLLRTD